MVAFRATPGEMVDVTRPGNDNGGTGPTVYIDARGADREGLARVERMVRDLDGTLEQRAVGAAVNHRQRNPGFWK